MIFTSLYPVTAARTNFRTTRRITSKIRLPNPIRLEGQEWKVGLTTTTLPDATSQLPPLMKGNKPMFTSNWVVKRPYPNRRQEVKFAQFKPSDLRSEDLETLTGVSFMKTMKAFFSKEKVSQSLESGYIFKDGKKILPRF